MAGLGQVYCVERTRRHQGKETVERAYAITSLPAEQADAARLLEIWRGHWRIENRLHWVRGRGIRRGLGRRRNCWRRCATWSMVCCG